MGSEEYAIEYVILLGTILLLIFVILLMILLFFFNRSKSMALIENEKLKAEYQSKLNFAKVEIAENSLKNIGLELHDNIGQLLTVASLESNMLSSLDRTIRKEDVEEVSEIISKALEQTRRLSKSLNTNYLKQIKLKDAIIHELDRIQNIGIISTSYDIPDQIKLSKDVEIILFRMIQEFIANSLKHSEASQLRVEASENQKSIIFIAQDNGKGFDKLNIKKSNGLLNIEDRANTIGANLSIVTSEGNGCVMTVVLKNIKDEEPSNYYS